MAKRESVGVWNRGRAALAALALLPAFALVGCGGGGGGGGGGSSGFGAGGTITAAAIVVTNGNSQALAAEAMEVSSDTDAAAGSAFVTGVQVSGSDPIQPMRLARAGRTLAGKASGTGTLATGASVTQSCTGGGTITFDVTASGSGIPAAGDSYSFLASNCVETDGTTSMVMNGRLTISVLSGSYDPASAVYPKSITMRMVTANFSVSAGGETEVFNGDLTMALTETSATSASVVLTSSSLASTIGSHHVLVVNYSLSVTETSTGGTMSISASVQTDNPRLGSTAVSYTITTVTPIAVNSAGVVTAGSIKVTGSNSALLLTATGPDTFSVQVDGNGDGTYESTSSVTRSQLQALL